MSDLRDVLADLSERWVMSPAEEQAYEADRMRRERRLNLAKMAEVITDTDLERIVNDRVDTYASKVIRRFLVAAAKPDGARFCWLSGATGRGKTVAACLAIAIERGRYIAIAWHQLGCIGPFSKPTVVEPIDKRLCLLV